MRNKEKVKAQTKSGAAAKKLKPYKFAKEMSFLLSSIAMRETSGNVHVSDDSSDDLDGDSYIADSQTEETAEDAGEGADDSSRNEIYLNDCPPMTPLMTSTPGTSTFNQRSRHTRSKRAKMGCDPFEEAVLHAVASRRNNTPPKPEDPDEMFLLSLLPTLKRLSDQQKASAKIKLQQLLYDVEFPSLYREFTIPQTMQAMSYQSPSDNFGQLSTRALLHTSSPHEYPTQEHTGSSPRSSAMQQSSPSSQSAYQSENIGSSLRQALNTIQN